MVLNEEDDLLLNCDASKLPLRLPSLLKHFAQRTFAFLWQFWLVLNSSCAVLFIDRIQVGLPYLKAKARDYYEQHGGGAPTELHTADQQRYRV
jgi:hypothetical protein